MKFVRKRDGRLQEWDQDRITIAISKAFNAVWEGDGQIAQELSDNVAQKLTEVFGDDGVATVEGIQDLVENEIMESGHYEVARAYILYRGERQRERELGFLLESGDLVESYVGGKDWLIKENANMGFSMQGLGIYITQKVIAPYWLMRVYPSEIRDAHISGDIHIHDLGLLAPYCEGWDLRYVLWNGFPSGVSGKLISGPPKHFPVALLQAMNFLYTLQGESAGANAFSNFDTYLAPGIHYDGLDYDEVFQALQGFMHSMNVPTRIGGQTPFTNISMDVKVPEFMEEEKVMWGGKHTKDVYGDFQDEVDMFNEAYVDVCTRGDHAGNIFSFPIPTYNITEDFNWEIPGFWEMVAKFGIPYFGNFMPHTGLDPSDVRAMCCHLRLDNKLLSKRGGGLFGAFPLTGSVGVVTTNLSRIGYLAKDDDDFFERLRQTMEKAKTSLLIKKEAIERYTRVGLYPYTSGILRPIMRKFGGYWSNHFLTFGCIGMNEACLNFLDTSIHTKEGSKLAKRVLLFMNELSLEYQNEKINDKGYPVNLFNVEATPGEGTTHRLALADKEAYPEIKTANLTDDTAPFYTNSTQLPVYVDLPLGRAIAHQEELQPLYTGGTVFHVFLGESGSSPEGVKKLVRRISSNSKLPYFTMTPTFSICPQHQWLAGMHSKCPTCGKDCAVYSRIVGYYRPVSQWNPGKQSEFNLRREYG